MEEDIYTSRLQLASERSRGYANGGMPNLYGDSELELVPTGVIQPARLYVNPLPLPMAPSTGTLQRRTAANGSGQQLRRVDSMRSAASLAPAGVYNNHGLPCGKMLGMGEDPLGGGGEEPPSPSALSVYTNQTGSGGNGASLMREIEALELLPERVPGIRDPIAITCCASSSTQSTRRALCKDSGVGSTRSPSSSRTSSINTQPTITCDEMIPAAGLPPLPPPILSTVPDGSLGLGGNRFCSMSSINGTHGMSTFSAAHSPPLQDGFSRRVRGGMDDQQQQLFGTMSRSLTKALGGSGYMMSTFGGEVG